MKSSRFLKQAGQQYYVFFYGHGIIGSLIGMNRKKTIFDLTTKTITFRDGTTLPFSQVKSMNVEIENRVMKYGSVKIFKLMLQSQDASFITLAESPDEAMMKEVADSIFSICQN